MKQLKFVSDDVRQKEFAAAVRTNVNDYFKRTGVSTKGNFFLVTQTVANLLAYLGTFVLILTVPMSPWLALPLSVLMGFGMAGIGMCVMHDAVHGSYSTSAGLNKLMGGTMYLLGSNVFNWKVQHNLMHHAYTNIEGYDEDIAAKGPIRLSEFTPWKKIHRRQHIHAFFFYGLMTISKLTNDFKQLALYNKEGITQRHHINPTWEYVKMLVVKGGYLFAFIGLPVILTPFTWWQVLIGFFIMHWTAGCILSTVFQMAHVVEGAKQFKPDADGVIAAEWAVHELRTTSDFARGNALLNWYIGGLNFQIEHHLFPNICHVHYREIAPIVERTAKEFGFVYNLKPSFSAAFHSHVNRLRQLGEGGQGQGPTPVVMATPVAGHA
ncbi:MAG: acyl-CoA desaturase [Bacteroidota bacterium]|nr:acyl-CoA desaturase [Bacteroidota bacterium]MDP4215604.1 acyl-CoA desaturase [Bacteroidota bacterium]MDP4246147.1 acyl-CoA desaturase [Bacteroidota bacterium]MDP4255969.1 acyl-CoA desaturase [Bacteroidota bacterium]MDP4259552.1 acyl-CoA desaturase [Bacteroidota bacterium]